MYKSMNEGTKWEKSEAGNNIGRSTWRCLGMLVIFEFIIVMAARFWFPGQPFTVSLVAAITTIVYMRWGYWGVIHAALGGVVYSFMSERQLINI